MASASRLDGSGRPSSARHVAPARAAASSKSTCFGAYAAASDAPSAQAVSIVSSSSSSTGTVSVVGGDFGNREPSLEPQTWWTATAEQEVLLSIGQRPSA